MPLSRDVQSAMRYLDLPCYHCEPSEFGSTGEPCEARKLMGTLNDDVVARQQEIQAEDGDRAELHRGTRYYFYRQYVFLAHGFLGKGVRVRIPLCVVEEIRHAFREPGCSCPRGGPLGLNVCGRYTGHKEAES